VRNGLAGQNLASQDLCQVLSLVALDQAKSTFLSQAFVVSYQPDLPLAMYCELAAHLSQVTGLEAVLIWQNSDRFNYEESQIAGLRIQLNLDQALELNTSSGTISPPLKSIDLISRILNHYGSWYIPASNSPQSEIKSKFEIKTESKNDPEITYPQITQPEMSQAEMTQPEITHLESIQSGALVP
jgi:hypothetical protein